MADLYLIHWNEAEVRERADRLRAWGYRVRTEGSDGARAGHAILADPPGAIVVDLARLPSHGRETAHAIRSYKAGRSIPIVFLPGDPLKMDKVRQAVPDAVWSTWETLETDLAQIVSPEPPAPAAPLPVARRRTAARTRTKRRPTAVKKATVRRAVRKKPSRR